MTDEIERLLVRVEANAAQFEAQMRKINKSLYGSQAATRQTLEAIKRDTTAMSSRMFRPIGDAFRREIAGLSGVLAGVFSANQLARFSDEWTRSTNQLRAGGLSIEDAARKMDDLADIAVRSRASLAGTAILYNRLTAASTQLGVSQERVARVVETTNKALATSRLSPAERGSALTQLAQGLGSGALAGDELKAIRENAQVLAQAIADEFDTTIGELKALGEKGELTSARVFRAIERSAGGVEAAFARTRQTVDDSFTNLQTRTIQFIGHFDRSTGASEKFAAAIDFVARHLDDIAAAAGLAAIAVGTGYGTAMTVAAVRTGVATVSAVAYQLALMRLMARQTGATTAQIALNAAISANPLGLMIVAAGALSAGLIALNNQYQPAIRNQRDLNEATEQADSALGEYERALGLAAVASGTAKKKALEHANALRELAQRAINAASALAQTRIQEALVAREEARAANARAQRTANQPSMGAGGFNVVQMGNNTLAATRARESAQAERDAQEAIAEAERLKAEAARILAAAGEAGSGGGSGGGGDGKGNKSDAEGIANLRERLDLEERLAFARSTGDERAIKAEEERQRLAELTGQYREAGYEDAAARALAVVAAEGQAEEIAERREKLAERMAELEERGLEARRRNADWTERQHDAELEIARLRGDPAALEKLEREAELRQRIAEYTERFGVIAGTGMALVEQGRVDAARAEGVAEETARSAARTFLDVVSADDPWEAAGDAFKRAAFNGLEDLLTKMFMNFGGGGSGGSGNIFSSIASWFAGGRAGGGGIGAGQWAVVGERGPEAIRALPGGGAHVLSNGALRGLEGGPSSMRGGLGPMQININLSGANGDAAIRAAARDAAMQGAALAYQRASQDIPARAARRQRFAT